MAPGAYRMLPNDGVDGGRVALEPVHAESSARVTHLTYAFRKR